MATTEVHPFANLEKYLEAIHGQYEACLGHIEHEYSIDGVEVNLRLHHVKFNGDSEPIFEALAECLVQHVNYYCISARKRQEPVTQHGAIELFLKARDALRKFSTSGETGELLLCFLLESVLKSPQVVCKLELKTAAGDEVKGGDGIHITWDEASDTLNVYLGEAKLYQTFGGALTSAFDSIKKIRETKRKEHELRLVTSHFKFLDTEVQTKISEYLDEKVPVGNVRIKHACLIGFDWDEYKHLMTDGRAAFVKEFETRYREHAKEIIDKTNELFVGFPHRNIAYEFFFIPFKNVQEFRAAFYARLGGGPA